MHIDNISSVKVIKNIKEVRSVTLRIAESTMERIDQLAHTHQTSRQHLIEATLEQAMNDKKFTVEINCLVVSNAK
jgi:predicted DNA binding CopG/RHH family protein